MQKMLIVVPAAETISESDANKINAKIIGNLIAK